MCMVYVCVCVAERTNADVVIGIVTESGQGA